MNALVSGTRLRPAEHLYRAAFAALRAEEGTGAEGALQQRHGHDPASLALLGLSRGATSPLATGDTGMAALVAGAAVVDFVATLAPESAAARLLTGGVRVDLTGRQSLSLPARLGRPNAGLAVVGEGAPIPVLGGSLGGVVLRKAKVAAIVTLTAEVANSPAGEAWFRQQLREDAAASLDAALLSAAPADEESPAGLLADATEVPAAAAGAGAMLADVEALGAAVLGAGGGVAVAFIAGPVTAFRLALHLTDQNLTIWPSLGVAEGVLIAVDPAALVASIDPAPRFDVSEQALLHMDTDPAQISTGGAIAGGVRSLFQTDTIGLRLILQAAWALRAPAVAVIPAVNW